IGWVGFIYFGELYKGDDKSPCLGSWGYSETLPVQRDSPSDGRFQRYFCLSGHRNYLSAFSLDGLLLEKEKKTVG
uniref:Uncharacterized protein n=1 Tax=Oryzias latipes TaxID=8090 RepID=A0A3B3HQ46_ORYLA